MGPAGSNGAIEMWPDTYFKSGYWAVENPYYYSRTIAELWAQSGNNAGALWMRDRLQEPTVVLATIGTYSGGLWVSDNRGAPVYSAGINGELGLVWGRTKSFIVPIPKTQI